MLGTVAVGRYVDRMLALGHTPGECLAGSGVDLEHLLSPDYRVSTAQYRQIVTRLLSMRGGDGIDLATQTFRELSDLGAVGYASSASRTVRETYSVWTRFGPTLLGMMGQLQIEAEDKKSVTFGVASPEPEDPLYRFSVEELLTMVRKVSRSADSAIENVDEMAFSFRAPQHADTYAELFACPIRFGAQRTSIRVSKSWFDQPAQIYDAEFSALCIQHCEKVLLRFDRIKPLTADLRWLLKRTRSSAIPTLEDAATALHISARTLRRRLREEGTCFREQVNEFRAEQAKHFLTVRAMSVKEIAYALGFEDQSAFSHAFKAWTGLSVREYLAASSGETH